MHLDSPTLTFLGLRSDVTSLTWLYTAVAVLLGTACLAVAARRIARWDADVANSSGDQHNLGAPQPPTTSSDPTSSHSVHAAISGGGPLTPTPPLNPATSGVIDAGCLANNGSFVVNSTGDSPGPAVIALPVSVKERKFRRKGWDADHHDDDAGETSDRHRRLLPSFQSFQRNFLAVYILCTFSDWLKGPYVYALYVQYGFTTAQIGWLFVGGFISSFLFGTVLGSCGDKMGRRFMCRLFCIVYGLSAVTKVFPSFAILFLGRVLSGIATSLLFSVFEAWMVSEHRSRGFPEPWLQSTFARSTLLNGGAAILAAGVAQVTAELWGYTAPFLCAIPCLGLAFWLMRSWPENVGDATLSMWATLTNGWNAFRRDSALRYLGTCEALFEASVYIWVFFWTPAVTPIFAGADGQLLNSGSVLHARTTYYPSSTSPAIASSMLLTRQASPEWAPPGDIGAADGSSMKIVGPAGALGVAKGADRHRAADVAAVAPFPTVTTTVTADAGSSSGYDAPPLSPHDAAIPKPPYGLLFAAFMGAMMLGSAIPTAWVVRRSAIPVHLLAAASLFATAAFYSDKAATFLACVVFEVAAGGYYPAHGTLRAQYIPEASRASVASLIRLPMNGLVIATIVLQVLPRDAFWALGGAQVVCVLCLWRFRRIGSNAGGGGS